MKLVMLGTTGYHPNELRHTACYAIPEAGVVLDAGTGMFRLRNFVETRELDIFLSHAHLDHVAGLTFMLGTLFDKKLARITVHGKPEKLDAVREHLFNPHLFPVPPDFEFRPLGERVPLAGGGELQYFPLKHPGGSVGFRLDWADHSLAYVTDTTAEEDAAYIDRIRGVDLLLHECYFGDDESPEFALKTGHSRTTPAANIAKAAKVGRLVLIHLNPLVNAVDPIGLDDARRVFTNTELAEDLREIEF